jgi:hypothetical protein
MSNIIRSLRVLHAPDNSTTAAENPHFLREPIREYRLLLVLIITANRLISQNWKCFKCEGGNLGPSSKSRKLHARASDASEPAMKVAARPDCASLDSVSIQSRSTKSCRSDENTEQNVSNVVSAVHKSGDTHPPLNGFDDECLGIDQHLRQDHAVEHSLNFLNVNPTELPFSGRSVDSTDSRRKFSDTNKSLDRSPISNQPHIIDSERTEVPNTPTQRSSQHNIPSPLLNLCGGPTEQDPLPSDGSLNIEPTPPARISFGTVLCTVCHKQRLLAKLGNTKAVWYVFASVLVHQV